MKLKRQLSGPEAKAAMINFLLDEAGDVCKKCIYCLAGDELGENDPPCAAFKKYPNNYEKRKSEFCLPGILDWFRREGKEVEICDRCNVREATERGTCGNYCRRCYRALTDEKTPY